MPGEALTREGKMGVGLFLLMKGAVRTSSTVMPAITLAAVAAFGERALRNQPSGATVRALRFCQLTILLRNDFEMVERLNPKLRAYIDEYIDERDKRIQEGGEKQRKKEERSRERDRNDRQEQKPVTESRSSLMGIAAASKMLARSKKMQRLREEQTNKDGGDDDDDSEDNDDGFHGMYGVRSDLENQRTAQVLQNATKKWSWGASSERTKAVLNSVAAMQSWSQSSAPAASTHTTEPTHHSRKPHLSKHAGQMKSCGTTSTHCEGANPDRTSYVI